MRAPLIANDPLKKDTAAEMENNLNPHGMTHDGAERLGQFSY
jgi:hypothetical protein